MAYVLSSLLIALSVGLLLMAILLLVEVVLALLSGRAGRPRRPAARSSKISVLVPAYNESKTIEPTLSDIIAQLKAGDRLLVVADNCSDDTAAVARRAGAEVAERVDPVRRGKAYALEFGVKHLAAAEPDVLIVVDADCSIAPNTLDRLAAQCAAAERPVQALYLMSVTPDAPIGTRIAAFAWRIKNWVRPLGLSAVGMPCHLTGTGMAFPWSLVRASDFGGASLVEDMNLGLELASKGTPATFNPEAVVTSKFATSAVGAANQRKRWEKGHILTITRRFPGLITKALRSGNLPLLVLALDLAIPPLTLFSVLILVSVIASGAAALLGLGAWPFILTALALGLLTLAVGLAWGKFGRELLRLRDLVRLPIYTLRKARLYPALAAEASDEKWIRTDRG